MISKAAISESSRVFRLMLILIFKSSSSQMTLLWEKEVGKISGPLSLYLGVSSWYQA
jgi:hypothetical protein